MTVKRIFECPKCGQRVTLHVSPSETPVCANYEKHHSKREFTMKEVSE